jgi:hypothetical protein
MVAPTTTQPGRAAQSPTSGRIAGSRLVDDDLADRTTVGGSMLDLRTCDCWSGQNVDRGGSDLPFDGTIRGAETEIRAERDGVRGER